MIDNSNEFISDLKRIKRFVDYYNQRVFKKEKITVSQIKKYLKDYYLPNNFSKPQKILINKIDSSKVRTVYIFPKEQQLLLKYLNFAINELDLNIHPNCFSFQKKRSVKTAINYLQQSDFSKYYCLKIDIADYFNNINIAKLKKRMPISLKEKAYLLEVVLSLLPSKGVLPGMPLAPTLSNIYLRDFDKKMSEKFPIYARYSDDMVFFYQNGDVLEFIKNELSKEQLTLNYQKTIITPPDTPFEFLGFSISKAKITLANITVLKIKKKIKRQARSLYRWQLKKQVPLDKTIMVMNRKFNRKFFGYQADETDFTWHKYYFKILSNDKELKKIDQYYQTTIRYLATGRYCKKNFKIINYQMLKKAGYRPLVSEFYKYRHLK